MCININHQRHTDNHCRWYTNSNHKGYKDHTSRQCFIKVTIEAIIKGTIVGTIETITVATIKAIQKKWYNRNYYPQQRQN